ncbi:MAG: hypothetical protein R3201_00070 [Oceanisphaera sp.]|nr:hypothetical protein [Oceanisphaera sp.]
MKKKIAKARASVLLTAHLRRLVRDGYVADHEKDAFKKGKIWRAKWDAVTGKHELDRYYEKLDLGGDDDASEVTREVFRRVVDDLGPKDLAERGKRRHGLLQPVYRALGLLALERENSDSGSGSGSEEEPKEDVVELEEEEGVPEMPRRVDNDSSSVSSELSDAEEEHRPRGRVPQAPADIEDDDGEVQDIPLEVF